MSWKYEMPLDSFCEKKLATMFKNAKEILLLDFRWIFFDLQLLLVEHFRWIPLKLYHAIGMKNSMPRRPALIQLLLDPPACKCGIVKLF